MLLVDLPPEVLLVIINRLDIPDILNIRQTCRTLFHATYDRAIWMSLLEEQTTYLPFASEVLEDYQRDNNLPDYSTSSIEALVVKACKIEEKWASPRRVNTGSHNGKLHIIKRDDGATKLLGLEMVFDRWILAVYFEGAVRLYDAKPSDELDASREDMPILRAFLAKGVPYMSYAISLDPSEKTLFLALAHPKSPHIIEIFRINLGLLSLEQGVSTSIFRLVHTITLPTYKNIKALSAAERLLVLSLPTGVELLPWGTGSRDAKSRKAQSIIVQNEDLESLVDGIIATTFFGTYLLIFRTHTLSIHDHNGASERPLPSLKHTFALTFRQVSFSAPSESLNPASEVMTYTMSIFAYDVIQGLFHYTIRLLVPPSSSELPPSLDVHLTGVYPLAVGIVQPSALHTALATTSTYYSNFSPRGHSLSSVTVASPYDSPTSDVEYASRGFLSAHCVGPQAKRAIWVERKRSSTSREVHVWNRHKPWDKRIYVSGHLDRGGKVAEDDPTLSSTVEMKRQVIYSLDSYDLRDDINFCAFGEIYGTIVLGHRSGDLSVLNL